MQYILKVVDHSSAKCNNYDNSDCNLLQSENFFLEHASISSQKPAIGPKPPIFGDNRIKYYRNNSLSTQ